MNNANAFREKMLGGHVCLASCISFNDPTVTEVLCNYVDMVWMDMEHTPLTLEAVQGHVMATRPSGAAALVRIPWNDPVLVKPVLDMGADGIIFPMVKTSAEARLAVSACKYPPAGIRGFGPRRSANYGLAMGPDFVNRCNETVMVWVQIEHVEAVKNLDEILNVSGITGILIGAHDLSGSMGLMGQTRHPDVVAAVDTIISKTLSAGLFLGMGIGEDSNRVIEFGKRGVHWMEIGDDYSLLMKAAGDVIGPVREYFSKNKSTRRSEAKSAATI